MNKVFWKRTSIICIIGILGLGYTVFANSSEPDPETYETDEVLTDILDKNSVPQDVGLNDDGDDMYSLSDILEGGEVTYYINMKRNEAFSYYYNEMDKLLLRKLDIYKLLRDSGEITDLEVKQLEAQEKQMACQKSICDNEAEYNRFVISGLELSFDDIDMKEIKNVDDIESYCADKSSYDILNIARYVTDCRNAIDNIGAKEKETETLAAASKQLQLLEDSGEASELEVIDGKLAALKAEMELEGYYYDMNEAYYLLMQ